MDEIEQREIPPREPAEGGAGTPPPQKGSPEQANEPTEAASDRSGRSNVNPWRHPLLLTPEAEK